MKFKPLALVFGAIAFSCLSAQAELISPGVAAGFNAGFVDATNVSDGPRSSASSGFLYGFGFAGTASLGLLQESFFGLEVAEDYVDLKTSAGGVSFGGKLWATSATAHFRFHWLAHYHELGFGYAHGNLLSSYSSAYNTHISSVMNGFALVGKDYLLVDKKSGPFLMARALFLSPGGTFSPLTALSVLLGFDF